MAAFPRAGKDFRRGSRVARLLRDAGLRDVQVRTTRPDAPGRLLPRLLLTLAGLLREPLPATAT
jgi:hypothetical protein